MSHSLKTVGISFVALVFILLGLFWFSPLRAVYLHNQEHVSTPITPTTRPTITTSPVPGNAQSKGVRLPLSEGIWLHGQSSASCLASQYRQLVKKTVDSLIALKLNVILDLHWSDGGGKSLQGGGPWSMPDADSVIFWQQVARYSIKGSNVVYDTHLYPYPKKQPATWDAAFGTISKKYPVISAESGEYDCGTSYVSKLLTYFDAHQIGWIAWAWVVQGSPCGYPQLILDYRGTPTPRGWGCWCTNGYGVIYMS